LSKVTLTLKMCMLQEGRHGFAAAAVVLVLLLAIIPNHNLSLDIQTNDFIRREKSLILSLGLCSTY